MKIVQRGISLIEGCVTLAISCALAVASVPSLLSPVASARMEGFASELATDLQHARTLAVSGNQPVRVTFPESTNGSCYVVHSGGSGSCRCEANRPPTCDEGVTLIKAGFTPSPELQVQSNVETLQFDPIRGTVTPAGTIRVLGPQGREIRHVVNLLGRVRSCVAPAGASGRSAC
jgi:type IV fimbrial biogenesis protein FimT